MALSAFLSTPWDPTFVIADCDCSPALQTPAFGPVDVRETEDSYAFEVDVPGLSKDQVKVKLENQGKVLALSGERKHEGKVEGQKYHRMERSRGAFERKFWLPKNANGEEIKASVKDGVLTVLLAKKKPMEPKVVSVEVQGS